MPREKPTAEYIRDLKESLKTTWSNQVKDDESALELVEQTYAVATPNPDIEDLPSVNYHSGTAPEAIARYKGLLGQRPAWKVNPGWGPKAESRAENAEKFLNILPWLIERRFGQFWIFNVEDVAKLGRGFTGVWPAPDRWSPERGYPQQEVGEDDSSYNRGLKKWKEQTSLPPIEIRNLPAEDTLVIISHEYGLIEFVQTMKLLASECIHRWGDQLPKLSAKVGKEHGQIGPTETIDVLLYGNETWLAYCVVHGQAKDSDAEIAKTFEHGMGIVPLAYTPGLTTSSRKDGRLWKSILKDSRDSIIARDELRARQATAIRVFPLPVLVVSVKTPATGEKERIITMDPRKPLVLWDDETAAIIQPQAQLAEAESLDAKITEQLERNLVPDVVRGMSGSSETPAWSLRQQLEQMDTVLMPLMENLALGAERIGELICRAIMSPWIDEDVYVRQQTKEGMEAVSMGPKEAAEAVNNIHATITRKQLIDRNQDLAAMDLAINKLSFPWDWAAEQLVGVENPHELTKRWLLEQIMKSEPYLSEAIQDVLRKARLIKAEQETMPGTEIMGAMGQIAPEWQQTIQAAMAGTSRQGTSLGQQIRKAGAPTGAIPGPSPYAPAPGGAMPGVPA